MFVVKKTGSTALSNRAVNYVFSSNNEIGKYWRSPYTKKSIDYVLSSTKKNLNEWVTVKANVKEHFKLLHDLDVNELNGVAIMTDTDNSKLKASKLSKTSDISIFFNGEYTPCDCDFKNGEKPVWQLSSSEVTHDKLEKMIYFKKVVLKIMDYTLFYIPYLSTPDPSVKR